MVRIGSDGSVIIDEPDVAQSYPGDYDAQEGMCMIPEGEDQSGRDKQRVSRRKVMKEGKLKELTITLKMGHPMFRPQQNIALSGCGAKVDGDYHAKKVTHSFAGTFTTVVVCKAGEYTRKKKKAVKKEQPSGGGDSGMSMLEPTQTSASAADLKPDPPRVTIGSNGNVNVHKHKQGGSYR
jgi:hypothetical protein